MWLSGNSKVEGGDLKSATDLVLGGASCDVKEAVRAVRATQRWALRCVPGFSSSLRKAGRLSSESQLLELREVALWLERYWAHTIGVSSANIVSLAPSRTRIRRKSPALWHTFPHPQKMVSLTKTLEPQISDAGGLSQDQDPLLSLGKCQRTNGKEASRLCVKSPVKRNSRNKRAGIGVARDAKRSCLFASELDDAVRDGRCEGRFGRGVRRRSRGPSIDGTGVSKQVATCSLDFGTYRVHGLKNSNVGDPVSTKGSGHAVAPPRGARARIPSALPRIDKAKKHVEKARTASVSVSCGLCGGSPGTAEGVFSADAGLSCTNCTEAMKQQVGLKFSPGQHLLCIGFGPPWPVRVELVSFRSSRDRTPYWVSFFGENKGCWVGDRSLRPCTSFTHESRSKVAPKTRERLRLAMSLARESQATRTGEDT